MGLINLKPSSYPIDPSLTEVKPKVTRKRKTKKDKDGNNELSTEVVTESSPQELPMYQSNASYKETYLETDSVLRGAIGELAKASQEIGADLDDIRSSKTLRKKYDYIANLQSSRATVISTMVSAAREMNNSIKNSHELELKRAKEMKLNAAEQDDVKSIQDMYNAFVSMPVQQNLSEMRYIAPMGGPNTAGLTTPGQNIQGYLPTTIDPEVGYQNYLQNMTPEQATMMISENPHINEVIAYNPNTGSATFQIYNSENNQFVQGIPTKDPNMFMSDMQFDFGAMEAHSNNLNESYNIVYVDDKGVPQPNEVSKHY